MSLVCLLTIVVMSAQAQFDQQKLGRVMRQLLPVRMEQNKMQKAIQEGLDSVLYGFDKHQYSGNAHTVSNYLMGESEFELAGMEYTLTNTDGKVIEEGWILQGDTFSKSTYEYDASNSNVLLKSYENYDSEGMELMTSAMFYGVKDMQFDASAQLLEMLDMGLFVCDSMKIFNYSEGDTTVVNGYFSFDAAGLPMSFVIGMDMGGVPLDFVLKFTYMNQLPTSALASISMMGGLVSADVISVLVSYDSDGQLTVSEIIPIPNDIIDIIDLGLERTKMVNTYANKKLHHVSNYTWNQIDSLNGEYVLSSRDYYTYYETHANVDTVFHYRYETQPAGIADVARIEVVVSPNPVKDMLNIRGQEETTEVNVFNAEGKLVLRSRVEAGEGSISVQSLSAGMYFIKLSNTQGVSVQQIVKQ